jgi:hypothetical protein
LAILNKKELLEDERIGFVDIGWRTLQDAIFILKKKKADFKLTSYYLAVTISVEILS